MCNDKKATQWELKETEKSLPLEEQFERTM